MRIISILLLLVLLTGCGSNKNDLYYDGFITEEEKIDNKDKNSGAKETIRILVNNDFEKENLQYIADNYMEKHQDISIVIDSMYTVNKHGLTSDAENVLTKLNIELMSGSSVDIVSANGISTDKRNNSGLFVDLYDFMDQDINFVKEDYYSNIFTSLENKNQLFVLPTAFTYQITQLNKNFEQNINISESTGSYSDMINIYNEYRKTTPNQEDLILCRNFAPVDYVFNVMNNFIDIDNKKAFFDSDEFIHLLNLSKDLPMDTGNTTLTPSTKLDSSEASIPSITNSNRYMFDIINARMLNLRYISEDFNSSRPMTNMTGDFVFSCNVFAITKSSKNKEASWDFLKYCISEESFNFLIEDNQDMDRAHGLALLNVGTMPINRKNFKTLFQEFYHLVNKNESINADDLFETIDKWNMWQECSEILIDPSLGFGSIYPFLYLFYTGQASADETANNIQRIVQLYLNE